MSNIPHGKLDEQAHRESHAPMGAWYPHAHGDGHTHGDGHAHEPKPQKVYVVVSGWDYEGWTLPSMVTSDREQAIQNIKNAPAPDHGEEYGVYEYVLGKDEQGDQIAGRIRGQKVWVRDE